MPIILDEFVVSRQSWDSELHLWPWHLAGVSRICQSEETEAGRGASCLSVNADWKG